MVAESRLPARGRARALRDPARRFGQRDPAHAKFSGKRSPSVTAKTDETALSP
jgi:hypothetical protein